MSCDIGNMRCARCSFCCLASCIFSAMNPSFIDRPRNSLYTILFSVIQSKSNLLNRNAWKPLTSRGNINNKTSHVYTVHNKLRARLLLSFVWKAFDISISHDHSIPSVVYARTSYMPSTVLYDCTNTTKQWSWRFADRVWLIIWCVRLTCAQRLNED